MSKRSRLVVSGSNAASHEVPGHGLIGTEHGDGRETRKGKSNGTQRTAAPSNGERVTNGTLSDSATGRWKVDVDRRPPVIAGAEAVEPLITGQFAVR